MAEKPNFEMKKPKTFPSKKKKRKVDNFVDKSAVIYSWMILLDTESSTLRLKLKYHPEFSGIMRYETVARELFNMKNLNATITGYEENSVIIEPSFSSEIARKYNKKDDNKLF